MSQICVNTFPNQGVCGVFHMNRGMRFSWILHNVSWYHRTQKYLKHLETSWNILKHLETSWNILKHLETSWNILKHLETSWNILKHLETSWNQNYRTPEDPRLRVPHLGALYLWQLPRPSNPSCAVILCKKTLQIIKAHFWYMAKQKLTQCIIICLAMYHTMYHYLVHMVTMTTFVSTDPIVYHR